MSFLDKLMFWKKKELAIQTPPEESPLEQKEGQTSFVPSKYHSGYYDHPIVCEHCNQKIEGKLKIIKQSGKEIFLHKRCLKDLKNLAVKTGVL